MTPEPGGFEHEPPLEQADPGTTLKHQEKIKNHPYINGEKFF